MYVSLYRRYRPQSFSEMVGQSAAVGVLRESLKEGRLGHAYLFSGPRGCGKTSAARLVAKTLNCSSLTESGESCGACGNCASIAMGEHLDVIEIDGASNRGIGEIRDLKSHVNLKPLSSKYKVYIIDEVHMLTEAAFNALLKTLEEPPANVVFLLATTEPHKVPVTIRSRCQHIPFHRIAVTDMVSRINYVAERENIKADPEAVWEISRQADGALRDALSLLEQAVTLGKGSLTLESVSSLMGGSNRSELEKWVRNLRLSPDRAISDLDKMLARGISVERLTESLFVIFRDIWLYLLWGEKSASAIENSESELSFLREESKNWEISKPRDICVFLGGLLPRTRYGMRLEVFSGLVTLELMRIIEGRKAQEEPKRREQLIRPAVWPADKQAEQEPEMPFWDDDFSDLTAAPEPGGKEAPVTLPKPAPREAPPATFAESLGDNDFSKLLSAIGDKALVFGAALLHADITEENGKLRLDFDNKLSPAESFLNSPQNKKVLSDAVYAVYGAGEPPKTNEEEHLSLLFQNGPPEIKNAREANAKAAVKRAGSAKPAQAADGADAEIMIKLMGAELLYVKNLHDEESEEERTE